MPFNSIKAAKDGRFPTVINDISLTLGQVNTLARIHDAIKERGDVEVPMAVAISTFKKSHKVVDGKFVTKKDMSEEYIQECITIELEEQKKTFSIEKEIFVMGTHVDARGNKRTFKEEDLDKIISAFNQGVRSRNGVPVRLGHSLDQPLLKNAELPNAGIVTKLRKQGGKIIALIENVPKMIKEFIENKSFKTVSAGLLANFIDPVLKTKFDLVLDHLALLGQTPPAIKSLAGFENFFTENVFLFSEKDGKIVNIELNDLNDESHKVDIPNEEDQIKQKEIKMSEERIKELEAKLEASKAEKVELSGKLKVSEKEKTDFTEKFDKIETETKEKELKAKEVEVKNFLESKEVATIILPYQRVDYTEVLMKTVDSAALEAKKAEILKYKEAVDLNEEGQANKREELMESDMKEEKEAMEERLYFTGEEKVELTHFELHKKAEKAVKDKEFDNYEKAVVAFSPTR